jgi:hypothetical protein
VGSPHYSDFLTPAEGIAVGPFQFVTIREIFCNGHVTTIENEIEISMSRATEIEKPTNIEKTM